MQNCSRICAWNYLLVGKAIVPDNPWIEGNDREHGGSDHDAEIGSCRGGMDRGEKTEIDQDGEQGNNKDIEHRPPADECNKTKHSGLLPQQSQAAEPGGEKQDDQADDLEDGHQDRGGKNDQADEIGAMMEKIDDPVDDGRAVGDAEKIDPHNRQQISRRKKNSRGEDESPGSGNT